MIGLRRRRRRPRTLLCAIARDETPYLAEWIDFHLTIGFDRILIYDNESVQPIAVKPGDRGRVKVRRWPTQGLQAPQPSAYADCLRREGRGCDWMMYLDLDEFLNLKAHDSVADFLADYEAFSAVAVHWRIFGSAGEQAFAPGSVLRRFTHAAPLDFEPNQLVKTLFRPRAVRGPGVHLPHFKPGGRMVDTEGRRLDPRASGQNYPTTFAVAQVNHYFTKSHGEFRSKCARGRGDLAADSPDKFRDEAIFAFYDRNEAEDVSILRHVESG